MTEGFTLTELGSRLRSDAETCVDLTQRALTAASNTATDAFVELFPQQAHEAARCADRELAAGTDRGPLHGIPIAIKDNIDTAGCWTRSGTAGFGHHRAEHDADVVARLRAEGAVVIGKTRMHELAWGMVTPGCRNPHDPERITGGSSGGSAAAVAAGIVPLALGTDTGGSVRNPAALCGVVGGKTAVDTTPLDGVAPLAPTQDTLGVFTTTVSDCRIAMEIIDTVQPAGTAPQRVGLISDSWAQRVEPGITAALDEAADRLREHGIDVIDIPVRHSALAPAASYVIMLREAAEHWLSVDAVTDVGALGDEIREQLRLGALVAEDDYARALDVRSAIRAGLDETLGQVDVLMLASSPVPASTIGAETTVCTGKTIPVATAHAAMTALASVSGSAALSVPGTPTREGLPTGVQLIGAQPDPLYQCATLIERG